MRPDRLLALLAVAVLAGACGEDDGAAAPITPSSTSPTTSAPASSTTSTTPVDTTLTPGGGTFTYAGMAFEVVGGDIVADPADPEAADLVLSLRGSNAMAERRGYAYFNDAVAVVDGADYDLVADDSSVELAPGDDAELTFTAHDLPADTVWDDVIVAIGEQGKVPVLFRPVDPLVPGRLPVSITTDHVLTGVRAFDGVPFDLAVGGLERSLDAADDTGVVRRAEAGTTFLTVRATVTTGADEPYLPVSFVRLVADGEVGEPWARLDGDAFPPGSTSPAGWVLVLPDGATTVAIRIGDPQNDPAFTDVAVDLSQLGGTTSP